jgi:hypothetical protein
MRTHFLSGSAIAAAALCVFPISAAAQTAPASAKPTPRAADGHPDLSGTWSVPRQVFKTQREDGSLHIFGGGGFGPAAAAAPRPTAPPNIPSYKPEFTAKVKYLADNESKTDQVFYCGRPGVPRIGPPRKILQTPREVVFLYEDMSGDTYRAIPTDGRPHRADANPSYNGDSVGHWEGDTLVIEATNFVEDTWFGEEGYLHSAAMRVIERLQREGDIINYQATVDDPNVLTKPWTANPKKLQLGDEPLEESPRCVEQDSQRLVNSDHHGQR